MRAVSPLSRARRFIVPLLAGAALLALVGWPEYRSRQDASALCAAIPPGERIETDDESLALRVRELKKTDGSLFVAGFHPDDVKAPGDTGAVLMVHQGAFPFGRNLCVLRVEQGVVRDRQTLFGADDYAWCRGEMRFINECDEPES